MRITNKEKLKMCKEHVIEKKSLSHISERYGDYDIGRLKYLIYLYKKYGEKPFINRENGVYKRDTKLMSISRVKNGESIRTVSLDLGLIDAGVLGDWVKKYDNEGEEAIHGQSTD